MWTQGQGRHPVPCLPRSSSRNPSRVPRNPEAGQGGAGGRAVSKRDTGKEEEHLESSGHSGRRKLGSFPLQVRSQACLATHPRAPFLGLGASAPGRPE